MLIEAYGERLIADGKGALYWKRKRWLIISDLHLGKRMHFRKKGMAIPGQMDVADINTIRKLITQYNPLRVILLGDLFHSDYNSAWERLAQFTHEYKKNLFVLVRGNHDILPEWHYGRSRLVLVDELIKGCFHFTHIPTENQALINVSGHVHPAVKLYGKGRQSVRLPAFFFRKNSILMPAFGRFTGSVCIKPKKSDVVIAMVEGQLVEVNQELT